MFSCEYCEIWKNTYFKEHLRQAASKFKSVPVKIAVFSYQ